MFKEQTKNELLSIYKSNEKIDDEITNIKIALHTLEKLGKDTKEIEKQLENVGIEFYKFKIKVLDNLK